MKPGSNRRNQSLEPSKPGSSLNQKPKTRQRKRKLELRDVSEQGTSDSHIMPGMSNRGPCMRRTRLKPVTSNKDDQRRKIGDNLLNEKKRTGNAKSKTKKICKSGRKKIPRSNDNVQRKARKRKSAGSEKCDEKKAGSVASSRVCALNRSQGARNRRRTNLVQDGKTSRKTTSLKYGKRTRQRSINAKSSRMDHSGEPPNKRSKTNPVVAMTTRSLRSQKDAKFDRICNCSVHNIGIFSSAEFVKSCTCSKRHSVFLNSDENLDQVPIQDNFSKLSVEIMCYIFKYLSLKEMLRMESMCKKIQKAVHASLRLREEIDFSEDVNDAKLFSTNLSQLTNHMFSRLLEKLPKLRYIRNFHPDYMNLYQSLSLDTLTVPAVCDSIIRCKTLEGIEISNMELLEYLVMRNAHPKIIGKFQNRSQYLPTIPSYTTVLKDNSKITNLHLVGCSIYYLPQMDTYLEHLYLRMVKFSHHHPFKDFSATKLKTFVMSHCVGPSSALKYIPLLTALADARGLERLELQRVPFLGGVIQHICEDNWQDGGFRRLSSITMGECKNALDADLGFLIIASAAHLESLRIQPSLTKDAVFSALAVCNVNINQGFEELCLGWLDSSPLNDSWTNAELIAEGMADVPESQSRITDTGMRLVGQCFPPLKSLVVGNCPHVINPILWLTPGQNHFSHVQELVLENCHSLRIEKFCAFLTFLPELRFLTLRGVFKEPPLGCSRVGLSAGQGLGISSALINPQPIVNDPAGLNNNHPPDDDDDDDDDDNDGANDPVNHANNNNVDHQGQGEAANNGDNAGNGRIENVLANHEGVNLNQANQNEDGEFENLNGRYNLRHSQKVSPGQSKSNNKETSGENITNTSTSERRKSLRLSSHRGNRSCRNFQDCRNNYKDTHTQGSSDNVLDKVVGVENGVLSRKGKALVTRKGLVSKVKSSKRKTSEEQNTAEEMSCGKKLDCCCVKETSNASCQVSHDDIRKANCKDCVKRRRSGRKSKEGEKIITPGQFKPGPSTSSGQTLPKCPAHHNKKHKPEMVDKCDSTNDPVWEDDHTVVLIVLHRRLEYLKLDAVGITELNIVCYKLHTLSVSRCRVLKNINMKAAPYLEKVHVSQCRKVDEAHLLKEIYRLPSLKSKFVSLRPLHHITENLYNDVVFAIDSDSFNYGTLMLFDYSDTPSQTNYNRLRMKSWINLLERMTAMGLIDHGFERYHDMENPNKALHWEEGESCDGSRWTLHSDQPWIDALSLCQNMEDSNMKDPEWKKAGVYCMEAKGHFSFWDAYGDIQEFIPGMFPESWGLYDCNVLTYVNMCDISGIPNKDALCLI